MIILTLVMAVVVACTLGVIRPIGFYHRESALERVAVALLHTVISGPIFYGQLVMVFYLMRRRRPLEILAVLCAAALPAAFQSSATVHTLEGLTQPGYAAESGFLAIFLLVAIVTLCFTVLYFYVVWQRVRYKTTVAESPEGTYGATETDGGSEDRRSTAAAAAAASAGQSSVLFGLLPNGLCTDLIFIKSEDHYLEVHTTAGSSLIKMRFADAIAELGDRGIKVHRSYWVATGHVTRSVRTGKRTVLRLTGDHRVPVSVTHMRAVRAILSG